ncbi:hypothetical protein BJ741DRAFT_704990 [Chytriomyces cf. hyalinus JEL632]|nr:hypothetical protein BJ741DRAFT_704990 [Chytriomyces cf. hyalinus JEL632]
MHQSMDYECEGLHAIDALLSYSHLQTLVPLPATRAIAEMLLCSFQARVDRAYAILDELESQKRRESSEDAGGSNEDMEVSDREEADEYADIKSAIRDVQLAAPWQRVLWLVNLIDTMGQSDGAASTNGVVRAGVGTDAAVDVEDEHSTDLDEKDSHWPNIAKKLYSEIVSTRNANRTIETVSEEEEQQAAPSLSGIVSFLGTVPHATSLQSAIEELWRILLTFKLGKLTVFVTPLDKDKFDDRILERPVDWYEKSIAQRNAVLAAATGDDDLAVISLTTAAESATPSGTRLASTRSATARQSKAKNYVEIDDESDAIPSIKSSDAIHVTDDTYEESPCVVQTARRTRSTAAKLSQTAKKSLSASSSAMSLVDDSEVVSVNVVRPASFYSSDDSLKHRGNSDKQEPIITYKSSTTSKQTRKNVKESDWLRSVDVLEENGATQAFRVDTSLIEGSRLPAFKKFNTQEQPPYPSQQEQQQSHQHHNTQSQDEYIYAPNRQQPYYKTHQTYPHQQDNNLYHRPHQYYPEHQQNPYYHVQQKQLDPYQYTQHDGPPPISDLPPPPPAPRIPYERESPRPLPATNAIYEQQVQANMYYHQEQQRNHKAPTNYVDLYQSAPPLSVLPMPPHVEEYFPNDTRTLYDVRGSRGSSTPSSSHRNIMPSAESTTPSTPAPASFTKSVSNIARSVIGNAYRVVQSVVGHSPNTETEIDPSRNTEIEAAPPRKRYSKQRETTPCSKLYESNVVGEDRGVIGVGVGAGGGTFRQHEGSQRSEKRSNAAAGGWGNEGGMTLFCDDDERDEELEMEKARWKRNRSSGGYRRDFDHEERNEVERAMCMECNRVEPMVGTNLCQDCQVGHLNGTGGHSIAQDIEFRTSAALADLLADEVSHGGPIRTVGASAITSRIMIPIATPPLTYANVAASANSRAQSTLAKQAEVICID